MVFDWWFSTDSFILTVLTDGFRMVILDWWFFTDCLYMIDLGLCFWIDGFRVIFFTGFWTDGFEFIVHAWSFLDWWFWTDGFGLLGFHCSFILKVFYCWFLTDGFGCFWLMVFEYRLRTEGFGLIDGDWCFKLINPDKWLLMFGNDDFGLEVFNICFQTDGFQLTAFAWWLLTNGFGLMDFDCLFIWLMVFESWFWLVVDD